MTGPRIGSLFSGYGGLDRAVAETFGGTTAWVSDIDKGANKVLAARYPDAPNIGDITAVDWAAVESVDILTGGFPCQDLSHAGKRAGLRPGTRSGLWLHMAHAIEQLQPRLVVAENVRGLLSAKTAESREVVTFGAKGGRKVGYTERALGRVLADLADLGYDARWHGLRAGDVGAPHLRYRVFLIATATARTRLECDACGGIDPDCASCEITADRGGSWPAPGRPFERGGMRLLKTPTANLATSGGSEHPDKRRAGGHGPTLADEVEHLLPTPAVNDMGAGKTLEYWDEWAPRQKSAAGRPAPHGKSLSIEALRLLPTPVANEAEKSSNVMGVARRKATGEVYLTNVIVTLDGLDPSEADASPFTDFGQYAPAIDRWEAVLGRSAPSPTEPTGRDGARRLSPRFVEWMMGAPEGWITDVPGITRNEALKALGNGVVPQQAKAALSVMLSAADAVES